MKRRVLASLLVIAVVAGLVGAATWAYFSDVKTSESNTFTAGTLTIQGNEDPAEPFALEIGDIGNMAPGDITEWVTIKVQNTGTLPAATYGSFTLADDTGLAEVLEFYDYRAQYFRADDTSNLRWGAGGQDPYFGTAENEDWFIQDGDTSLWTGIGGDTNLRDWVDQGFGPGDNRGAWDAEALPAGGYYVLSFRLQMDPAAGNSYQATSVVLGYEIRATQVNAEAILLLGITNIPNLTVAGYDVDYFNLQLTNQWQ